MRAKKENAAMVGIGAAACAACCAGPILGVLTAIGLGTAAGFALFGTLAIAVGAALTVVVVVRRRAARRAIGAKPAPVPVSLTPTPPRA